jgi:uncharacterized protein (DUF952 family)
VRIFHIALRQDWQRRSITQYIPSGYQSEGFVHCSTRGQIRAVANERFEGRTDLVLLEIDPDRLTSPLVWEDCYETGMDFPHVYGPVNDAAVISADDFVPGPDGCFDWWEDA